MIRYFKRKIISLTILINLLDDAYPFRFRELATEYYNAGFTSDDKEPMSNYIDKVIKFTEELEVYEISADLLKIKNSL